MSTSQSTIIIAQAVTIVNEAVMNEASLPGRLVEFVNASGVANFQNQATASLFAEKQILIENDLLGYGVTKAAAISTVQRAAVLRAGDRANIRLAAAQSGIVPGTYLESAGGGQFQKFNAGIKLAVALAAQTTTPSAADDMLLVEIL